jgi:hypothetical protein
LKAIVIILLTIASLFAYYLFVYRPRHQAPREAVYVLPTTAPMVDTPADIRQEVDTLRAGQRLEVLARSRNWAHVRTESGQSGWVEGKDLVDGPTYEAGQRLLASLEDTQAQALGHTSDIANLRLEPSREGSQLALLPGNQAVEVLGRRLVDRPLQPDQPPTATPIRDAWYLVRADSKAGWILGRLVALDIPEAVSVYTQGVNMVAWFVLSTVADNGRQVPQYLVAERTGASEYDFDHIRVFTWWIKNQKYATAYVESNLSGYFPIRLQRLNGVPHFRLRVVDGEGNKVQRVYGLFDTETRLLGVVPGWETDAMPTTQRRSGAARGRRSAGHR